jgi:hypothetical protein
MQNAGLGSVPALTHLGETGAVPSAFYTVLCVVTATAALPVVGRRRTEKPAASSPPRDRSARSDSKQAQLHTF